MYKNLFKVLCCLEETRNIISYNIITNGLLIKRDDIDRLNELRKLEEIKLSLEHSNPIINDNIRGKGSFEKCMEVYEMLRRYFSKRIVFMYTLAGYNYRDLVNFKKGEHGLLDFAESRGVDAVILERFIPLGRGKLLANYCLDELQWKEVIKQIMIFAGLDMDVEELNIYKAFYIELSKSIEVRGAYCNIGEDTMALMPNGDVYPCRRLPIKASNIMEEDLNKIMIKMKTYRDEAGCAALRYAK